MLMSATEVVILDPRAAPPIAISPYRLKADISRRGLRVALFSNGFYDATNLMKAVEAALRPALDEPVFSLYARLNASLTAPPEVIAEAARNNDVAVTALGHCGSCTSSATRDAVALASAGIPVCVLISEKFHEMSGFIARSVGMPDLPRVKLPHPVAGTGAARIAEIAAGAAPVIISMWEAAHVPA